MAEEHANIESVRVVRRGGAAAITLAFLSLLIAIAALVFAYNAIKTANDSKNRVDSFETRLNASLGQTNSASTGSGTGPNVQQPAAEGTTTPNGNGQ